MNFEGQYLTYEEYVELGGTLEEAPFNLLEFEIRKKVDKETQMRLINCDVIPNEVKLCIYNLIGRTSEYAKTINNSNTNIASENTNGYSVSYINASNIKEIISSKENEITTEINTDLFGVIVNGEHIIYKGVKEC